MIAQYETKAPKGRAHITAHRYGDLQNLPHWHTEYELVFSECRTAEVLVGKAVYMLDTDSCLFIPSGEVHYIKAEAGSVLSVIKLDPEMLTTAFAGRVPTQVQHRRPPTATAVFDEIAAELKGGKEYCELISDSRAICLLAELFRGAEMRLEQRERNAAEEKYKLLLNLLAEKYADITFSDAAAFMCFSEPYFSKYFCLMSGMHFTDYLNIVRVNAAVRMLNETHCSVTEIALCTGFGTIRSFNRVFKAVTGYTPRTLPTNYVFIRGRVQDQTEGIDPTVSATLLV